MERFTVLIEKAEDGTLWGTTVELHGCQATGTSMDELLENMRHAIEACRRGERSGMNFVGLHFVEG